MISFFHRFFHLFGRHRYFVIKEFSPDVRKIGCKFCKKTWCMNDRVKLVIGWDSDFDKLYSEKEGWDTCFICQKLCLHEDLLVCFAGNLCKTCELKLRIKSDDKK